MVCVSESMLSRQGRTPMIEERDPNALSSSPPSLPQEFLKDLYGMLASCGIQVGFEKGVTARSALGLTLKSASCGIQVGFERGVTACAVELVLAFVGPTHPC